LQGARVRDQKEHFRVGRWTLGVIARPGRQLGAAVKPSRQLVEGQLGREQRAALGVAWHQVEQVAAWSKPVDVIVAKVLAQLEGGQRVEVVASGQQQRVGDVVELGLARGQIDAEASVARVQPLGPGGRLLVRPPGPQPDREARVPQGEGDRARPAVPADDQNHDRAGVEQSEPAATGPAVKPYTATVPKIAMNAIGRMSLAPLTPALASVGPNEDAVAAATIPRGSSQPMNARSRRFSVEPRVAQATTRGRTTRTMMAISASPSGSSEVTVDGVTEAEISTNRIPISSFTTAP